jgi:photosystem II stability/assembly factor-like uncharacterized protein
MKHIIVIVFILWGSSLYSQSSWIQQYPPSSFSNCYFYDVIFLDSLTGFIGGTNYIDTSFILKTTNGGQNWETLKIFQTTLRIQNIIFINYQTGFVTGGGLFMKTTDSGANWYNIALDSPLYNIRVYFLNQYTGFATNNNKIFSTSNSGVNWTLLFTENVHPAFVFNKFCFINQNTGYLQGNWFILTNYYSSENGIIYKTTNTGLNWQNIYQVNYKIASISFINENEGIYASGSSSMHKTTNGGQQWIQASVPGGVYFYNSCLYLNSSIGFAVAQWYSSAAAIIKTTNGGLTYDNLKIYGNYYNFQSIYFSSQNTGWTVGYPGLIYKTTNCGAIGILNNSEEVFDYHLSQNYPNPFNPITNIKFNISKSGFVSLKVYDIQGREIKTLINEKLSEGSYETIWDASNFPSGVYFYKLTAGNYSETKKMLLIK